MEELVKGDVVVMPFPFSDLSTTKKRPAVVLARLNGDDLILCQITSRPNQDNYSIPATQEDFLSGSLRQDSNIRPNKIFTADTSIIDYKIGTLKSAKTKKVVDAVCGIIKG
ncbi:MAG: type II toxin-antitoxin system PemK/MazF family toxin [Candidatus Diapherotrites archaeon]|nr:type II toxin-antitoxin system PemK/MazF family toxin [Candidatus Diapherotrites archaeon]